MILRYRWNDSAETVAFGSVVGLRTRAGTTTVAVIVALPREVKTGIMWGDHLGS